MRGEIDRSVGHTHTHIYIYTHIRKGMRRSYERNRASLVICIYGTSRKRLLSYTHARALHARRIWLWSRGTWREKPISSDRLRRTRVTPAVHPGECETRARDAVSSATRRMSRRYERVFHHLHQRVTWTWMYIIRSRGGSPLFRLYFEACIYVTSRDGPLGQQGENNLVAVKISRNADARSWARPAEIVFHIYIRE